MKYPECYPQRVCSANSVAFPHGSQLSFHKNLTSVPLSFHLHPSVQGFLCFYCYYSLQCCSVSSPRVSCAQHTLLSLCSHGPVPPRQLSRYLWGLVCHAVLYSQGYLLCSGYAIWTSAAYVLFLMSFPIVFSLNHSAPPSLFPSLLKSFPGPPSCHPWKPISFHLGVFLFFLPSHLFSIYSPFGQMSWSLTKHILFSLWKMFSILSQISIIPTSDTVALKWKFAPTVYPVIHFFLVSYFYFLHRALSLLCSKFHSILRCLHTLFWWLFISL